MDGSLSANGHSKIHFRQGRRIIESLPSYSAGDEELLSTLKEHGFSAFQPLEDWYFGLAQSNEEIDEQKIILREETRRSIRRKLKSCLDSKEVPAGYFESEILTNKLKEREAFLAELEQKRAAPLHNQERYIASSMCVLESRRRQREVENPAGSAREFELARKKCIDILRAESRNIPNPLWSNFPETAEGRINLFLDVSTRLLSPLGFSSVQKNSKAAGLPTNKVIYLIKMVNKEFYLRWSMKETFNLVAVNRQNQSPALFEGQLDLFSTQMNPSKLEASELGIQLQLPYIFAPRIVDRAFMRFYSNRELEAILHAHCFMITGSLSAINPVLEDAFG